MVNNEVDQLHSGFFGNLSFESIFLNNTAVRIVAPSAIGPLQDQIRRIEITFSRLEAFPFKNLGPLSNLSDLHLENNNLTLASPIESMSLKILSLSFNQIRTLEGWVTPNLRKINLSEYIFQHSTHFFRPAEI